MDALESAMRENQLPGRERATAVTFLARLERTLQPAPSVRLQRPILIATHNARPSKTGPLKVRIEAWKMLVPNHDATKEKKKRSTTLTIPASS